MSSDEIYSVTWKNYDRTRIPIGVEIIVGCFAQGPCTLDRMVVLDAGCGTGSYSQALLRHVGRIEAVDVNEGMLSAAENKLAKEKAEGRIAIHRVSVDSLPFADRMFDGIMMNQVLHHIPDSATDGYPLYRRLFEGFARVLKPGGILVVNICSHEQLRHGWWYYHLLGDELEVACGRHISLDNLSEILSDCGFVHQGRFVPLDGVIQGESYFDPHGPMKKHWRDGDSTWARITDRQLDLVLSRLHELEAQGELENYMALHDAKRKAVGQVTFVYAALAATPAK